MPSTLTAIAGSCTKHNLTIKLQFTNQYITVHKSVIIVHKSVYYSAQISNFRLPSGSFLAWWWLLQSNSEHHRISNLNLLGLCWSAMVLYATEEAFFEGQPTDCGNQLWCSVSTLCEPPTIVHATQRTHASSLPSHGAAGQLTATPSQTHTLPRWWGTFLQGTCPQMHVKINNHGYFILNMEPPDACWYSSRAAGQAQGVTLYWHPKQQSTLQTASTFRTILKFVSCLFFFLLPMYIQGCR